MILHLILPDIYNLSMNDCEIDYQTTNLSLHESPWRFDIVNLMIKPL